jgi:YhcH/YjgK/YiaL family protein
MRGKNIIIVLIGLLQITIFSNTMSANNRVRISEGMIKSPFKVPSDSSVDLRLFEDHYRQFPDRWDIAFDYLSNNNLIDLPCGKTDLSKDVYVTVSEYQTKEKQDALYESHKKYIDLQYIVIGNEYIGFTNSSPEKELIPYDEGKDITFYDDRGGKLLHANPEVYFIFFPTDLHQPCIQYNLSSKVKKIVVKIKFK